MSKSAFTIEYKRAELAAHGKLLELKQLYTAKYPEIPDLNSAQFWNGKFQTRKPLREQDGMTQERVRTVASYYLTSAVPGETVLDIGMGDGWVEELLEKKDVTLYGNDISDRTIHNVKKRFKGSFSVQSLYKLDYNRRFDAVFLLEVLEHVPPSKTFKLLKDIKNLLTPNGYFILSVPTNEGLETMADNPNGHMRMYTVPLIRAELELSGFKVLKLRTLYAFPKFYTVKKMLARIWRGRWQPNNIVILAQKTSR